MAQFNNQKQLESWLADKPILWGVAIAARSALRAIPFLATELLTSRQEDGEALAFLFLQAFRASSLAWVAASFPDHAASLSRKDLSGFDPAKHLPGSEAAGVRKAAFAAAISIEANTPRRASAAVDYSINAMSEYVATVTLTEPRTSALDVNTSRSAQQRAIVIVGWKEVSDDASALERGAEVSQLAQSSLWLSPSLPRQIQAWNELKLALRSRNEDWDVWIDWYEARLRGDVALEALEVERVQIEEDFWRQGSKVVNAEIKRLIEGQLDTPRDQNVELTVNFSKLEDVERWLESRPHEVAVVLAARAALRVVPLLAGVLGRGIDPTKARRDIILPVWRGMAMPWVVAQYPTHSVEVLVALAASDASRDASSAASYASISAAVIGIAANVATAAHAAGAAYIVGAADAAIPCAAGAIQAAASAASASVGDANPIWAALSADAAELGRGASTVALARQPLWLLVPPIWARERWARLTQALLAVNEDWEVWTEWYDARLDGRPANEALEIARVMIVEEIWEQGAKVVNAEIRRLINEFTSQTDAKWGQSEWGKDKWSSDTPAVPAQRPAAVEPYWDKSKLTVPNKPARADLDKKKFSAALAALRAELRDLANDVNAEPNIDKRPALFLQRLADRIPNSSPPQEELFRLGHAEGVLVGFAKTVDQEWPDFLASRYHALSLQFERTMRQSPLWREFKRNAAKETLSADQVSASKPLAREAAKVLRAEEAEDFVDSALPRTLERLAEAAQLSSATDDVIDASMELLAADLIESVNNTLKPIAEVALASAGDYSKEFGKGFRKAAKKQGAVDGQKAFKWLRRLALACAGGAAGTGSFAALSQLLSKYPEAFGWLERVFQHILKL